MITNEKEATYPISQQKIWDVKVIDKNSTDAYRTAFDEFGNIVDLEAIRSKENAEYAKKYGKLEIDLFEKLEKIQPNEMVKVAIWLTSIDMNTQLKSSNGEIDEKAYGEFIAAYKQAIAVKNKPVIDAVNALGFKTIYASQYAPLIFAELPRSTIMELQNRSDVDRIYVSRDNYKLELNSIAPTEKANAVWSAGINGSGIKVAIVEYDGIAFANPYLADGIYYNSVNKNIGSHATYVAGVVASTNATYKGIAYRVPALLSANSQDHSDANITAATEWALNNGANIISNSWGWDSNLQMTVMDKYLDHLVFQHHKTVIKSAGTNYYNNITSPGLGYNMITVGAFDDMDNSLWSNDVMSWYSAFKDPISPHNDREKPEVVAVGDRATTTRDSTPWIGRIADDGTSLAVPSVAGEAALLMQTKSWLKSWPETVKAVIMASAAHNIEGSNVSSDRDGAGGIDIYRAYQTANNNRMAGNLLYDIDFPKEYTFTVSTVGQKVRVAIAWDSRPDNNHRPTNDPLSDLDLYIIDPAGNAVAMSTTYDNSYEIVEFTAQTTGTYKARINKYGSSAYEYLGFAYTYV